MTGFTVASDNTSACLVDESALETWCIKELMAGILLSGLQVDPRSWGKGYLLSRLSIFNTDYF